MERKTFSSRLWGNISTLEQRLSNSIINSLASGGGVVEALKTMKTMVLLAVCLSWNKESLIVRLKILLERNIHFAVEGVRKSLNDVGVSKHKAGRQKMNVFVLFVVDVMEKIKDDWHPPYHGRCRCTEIPIVPEISDDIDKLYEEMFGDEFASKQWGIKLNHPKVSATKLDLKSVLDKTNMQEALGKENYSNF